MITIDKAIEIKERWRKANYPPPLADEINADNLSIEALKRLQQCREEHCDTSFIDLPGETEE